MKTIVYIMIQIYRGIISPFLHVIGSQFIAVSGCRYYPSCSEYASGAIKRHGIKKGVLRSFKRLMSCWGRHPGGYDPA